jgi:hypothetical protein
MVKNGTNRSNAKGANITVSGCSLATGTSGYDPWSMTGGDGKPQECEEKEPVEVPKETATPESGGPPDDEGKE